MIPRVTDTGTSRQPSVRIEDIATIQDASLYAREHFADIPTDLYRRVWDAKPELTQKQLRPMVKHYKIRTNFKIQKQHHHESHEWITYEVRRCAVAELESLPRPASQSLAASSNEGIGVIEASAAAQGTERWRLTTTPRNMKELLESLCQKTSQRLTPFGEDLHTMPLGARLSSSECFRRLICFRFDVEYTSLPLGTKKLQTFVMEACEREQLTPAERGGLTAGDLAEALQSLNEMHIWPNWLIARTGKYAVSMDWTERAEQFVAFLQTAALQSLPIAETLRHIRHGQLRVLALWWMYLDSRMTTSISRPSLLTTLILKKKHYIPVDAVKAPDMPYFASLPLFGLPKITPPRVCQLCGSGFSDWHALAGHCDREHGGFNEYRKDYSGRRTDVIP